MQRVLPGVPRGNLAVAVPVTSIHRSSPVFSIVTVPVVNQLADQHHQLDSISRKCTILARKEFGPAVLLIRELLGNTWLGRTQLSPEPSDSATTIVPVAHRQIIVSKPLDLSSPADTDSGSRPHTPDITQPKIAQIHPYPTYIPTPRPTPTQQPTPKPITEKQVRDMARRGMPKLKPK